MHAGKGGAIKISKDIYTPYIYTHTPTHRTVCCPLPSLKVKKKFQLNSPTACAAAAAAAADVDVDADVAALLRFDVPPWGQ